MELPDDVRRSMGGDLIAGSGDHGRGGSPSYSAIPFSSSSRARAARALVAKPGHREAASVPRSELQPRLGERGWPLLLPCAYKRTPPDDTLLGRSSNISVLPWTAGRRSRPRVVRSCAASCIAVKTWLARHGARPSIGAHPCRAGGCCDAAGEISVAGGRGVGSQGRVLRGHSPVYNKKAWLRLAVSCWGSACKRRRSGDWPMGGCSCELEKKEESPFPLLTSLISLSRLGESGYPGVLCPGQDHESHSAFGTWRHRRRGQGRPMRALPPARSQRLL